MPRKQRRKGGKVPSMSALYSAVKKVGQSALNSAKEKKILSEALKSNGYAGLAGTASAFGYGKRKRRPRRGGSFLDFVRNIAMVPGNIVMGSAAGLNQGIRGLGRRGGASILTHNVARPMLMV